MNISAKSQWTSSAVEYSRLKRNVQCRQGEGGMWGLTDVETGGVSGLEDKLVCRFKLVVDVVWGGVRQFVYDTNRPAFLERDLVGLSVDSNWQVWVQYCVCLALVAIAAAIIGKLVTSTWHCFTEKAEKNAKISQMIQQKRCIQNWVVNVLPLDVKIA